MQTVLVRVSGGLIERPIAEVRAQYNDMRYHAAQNVHPDIRFTIHDVTGSTSSFSQEISVAGMRQVDEVVNTSLPNGDLRSEIVGGMNRGGTLVVHFEECGPTTTRVHTELRIPVAGIRLLLAPILGAGAQEALDKAFVQDRQDLEAGNYARYRELQAAHPV